MKHTLALILASLSSVSMADQFYVTVGVECNKNKSELVVWFRGAWNEAGERAIANLGQHSWDAQKLVSFTQNADGRYSIHRKTEISLCLLGKHQYTVDISPEMAPGFHPEGWCATRIGAVATIKLNNKVVARDGVDACTERGRVTTSITIKPRQAPHYEKVKAEVFYGG
jgi:hypothetical protein